MKNIDSNLNQRSFPAKTRRQRTIKYGRIEELSMNEMAVLTGAMVRAANKCIKCICIAKRS